jgi:hypothetical protein
MRTRQISLLGSVLVLCIALLAACSHKLARTDAQVASDVQNKIYSDSAVQSRSISVQAADGVVTLSGDVTSDAERAAAANDAGAVDGVKTVINNLQVQQAQTGPRTSVRASGQKKAAKQDRARRHQGKPGDAPDDAPVNDLQAKAAQPASAPAPPAQQAAPPAPAPPQPPQKVTIPAGTQLSVRLNDSLDSEKNQVGDTFHASLSAPIVINGETVIPTGADILGRVANVQSAGRFAGASLLTLELTSLSVNGRSYNIQTNQWSQQGNGKGKNTATKVGIGTLAGAALGGLIGGGKGAAIGAAGGAGAGTGASAAKKGQQIKLAPEAVLNFQTINTFTVSPQSTNNRDSGRTPLS